ncbi:uncharacterized protein TNCV_3843941 [Trichonephila clavipes]|nr:uncharacterized protein TNCV_3843941 [Trichonephila clavipes]
MSTGLPRPNAVPKCDVSKTITYYLFIQRPFLASSQFDAEPPVATVAWWSRYRIVADFVMSSSPVPLKTRRVGKRCTLNLSRAQTSSRWRGVVVRRGDTSSGGILLT